MKKPDENKIAAYIDGNLEEKELTKIDNLVANNPDLQKTVIETLKAKRTMQKDDFKELPWQLKSIMQNGLEKEFTGKAKLVLKLIKNGMEEIANTLNGTREILTYNVRNVAQNAPVFHYMHNYENLTFDIYTYFEDNEHIRIKLEITDSDETPINGQISFKRVGDGVETKATKSGVVEFERVRRGDYEFRFEYEDILESTGKPKNVYIFLALD